MRHADASARGTGQKKEQERGAQMKGGLMSIRVTVWNESCAAEKQRGLTSDCVSGWVSGHSSGAASVT